MGKSFFCPQCHERTNSWAPHRVAERWGATVVINGLNWGRTLRGKKGNPPHTNSDLHHGSINHYAHLTSTSCPVAGSIPNTSDLYCMPGGICGPSGGMKRSMSQFGLLNENKPNVRCTEVC